MSDAEKVVAELRASATKLEKTFKVAPPLKLDESELMRRAAAIIADQAARLAAMEDQLIGERWHADEAARQRDVAKAALTAAEAEKERLKSALEPFSNACELYGRGLHGAIKPADLRAARAALSEKEQGDV